MSNGEFCCAIGLCCPPASASRRSALINELSHGMAERSHTPHDETLGHVADWLIENVDMAPAGSLEPLIEALTQALGPKH